MEFPSIGLHIFEKTRRKGVGNGTAARSLAGSEVETRQFRVSFLLGSEAHRLGLVMSPQAYQDCANKIQCLEIDSSNVTERCFAKKQLGTEVCNVKAANGETIGLFVR